MVEEKIESVSANGHPFWREETLVFNRFKNPPPPPLAHRPQITAGVTAAHHETPPCAFPLGGMNPFGLGFRALPF